MTIVFICLVFTGQNPVPGVVETLPAAATVVIGPATLADIHQIGTPKWGLPGGSHRIFVIVKGRKVAIRSRGGLDVDSVQPYSDGSIVIRRKTNGDSINWRAETSLWYGGREHPVAGEVDVNRVWEAGEWFRRRRPGAGRIGLEDGRSRGKPNLSTFLRPTY
jgi:hypothetical protein